MAIRLQTTGDRLLLVLFAVLLFGAAKAQGNLQFNQVVIIDLAPSGTQNFTVPAGKVWKIESCGTGTTTPGIHLRNMSLVYLAFFGSSTSGSSVSYPFWLPSNYAGNFQNNSSSQRSVLSIIEFNVVP
jgi:hypothetical protein